MDPRKVAASFLSRIAMSLQEALTTLGFNPGSSPPVEDIKKAQRQKTLENHPDRGGDLDKMVAVNVAADILLGKRAPDGARPGRYQQQPTPQRPPEPPPAPVEPPPAPAGVPLANVLSDVGSYKISFVSETVFTRDYYKNSQDETLQSDIKVKVFVGVKSGMPHICGFITRIISKSVPRGKDLESRAYELVSVPLHIEGKSLAKKIPEIANQMASMLVGQKIKKWYGATGNDKNDLGVSDTHIRATIPTKDMLIAFMAELGGSDTPDVTTRIPPIELVAVRKPKDEILELKKKLDYGRNFIKFYDWSIEVSGKKYPLSETEVEGLKDRHFIFSLAEPDIHDKGGLRKNLTKLRGGVLKMDALNAFKVLSEVLHGGALKDIVTAVYNTLQAKAGK